MALLKLLLAAILCLSCLSCAPKQVRVHVWRAPLTGDYHVTCEKNGQQAYGLSPDRERAIRECKQRLARRGK